MQVGSMDLKICQGGSGSIPHCRNEQMRLSEDLMNLEENLDQRIQLTEEEDQNDILMIGGMELFLPCA
jgi:hypothetical protein